MLHSKMGFFKQIKAITDNAAAGVSALIRLLANFRGPTFTSSYERNAFHSGLWRRDLSCCFDKEVYRRCKEEEFVGGVCLPHCLRTGCDYNRKRNLYCPLAKERKTMSSTNRRTTRQWVLSMNDFLSPLSFLWRTEFPDSK